MKIKQRVKPAPFSKILKSLMKEKNLTMREVAKIAGVSASTINDWQSGSTPENYMAVKKLAKEFGVSFSFLLTGEDESAVKNHLPSVTEVFDDGGALFDGYAKITIQRLIPRNKKEELK
jgi:transcriptional regulator with XRE-family HTH domain